MRGARAPIPVYNPAIPPASWTTFMGDVLGASPGLSRKLWRQFRQGASSDEIQAVIYAKMRPGAGTWRALVEILTPAKCFTLLALVSPEGEPRDPAVIACEAALMGRALSPEAWRPVSERRR